jgi:hypothetical protein
VFYKQSNATFHLGARSSQRNKYRRVANYDGMYAVLSTTRERTERDRDGSTTVGEKEFLTVLPLTVFISFFASPLDVHNSLKDRALHLCAEWNKLNGTPSMRGKRTPLSLTYDLCKSVTKTNRGRLNEREDIGIFKIQLTSYGYTVQTQQEDLPVIKLKDIRVNLFVFICYLWLLTLFLSVLHQDEIHH